MREAFTTTASDRSIKFAVEIWGLKFKVEYSQKFGILNLHQIKLLFDCRQGLKVGNPPTQLQLLRIFSCYRIHKRKIDQFIGWTLN